jgi:hypothetical protein
MLALSTHKNGNHAFLFVESTAKVLCHREVSCKETQTDPLIQNSLDEVRPYLEHKITQPLREQLTNGHDASSTSDYRTVFR